MSSFQKLFVNSTNRISQSKNILLFSHDIPSSTLNNLNTHHFSTNSQKTNFQISSIIESSETFEQLQLQYQQLSLTIQQAHKEKLVMQNLIDIIFKVQQGQQQKIHQKIRRKKNQLQSKYQCTISSCKKAYGSSASLVRHNKMKHTYAKLEPPAHNYQIPPSPNLSCSNLENRPTDMQETLEKDGDDSEEEGAAKNFKNDDFYEADCENQEEESEELEITVGKQEI